MAIVEEVPDNSQDELNWGLRNRVPLKNPSEVRRAKPLKPLVDLGLPAGTQGEVLQHIQNSFQDGSGARNTRDRKDEHEDQDDSDYDEEDEDVEYEPVEGEDPAEVKDPNEEFWDEFFDSLIVTVPFTFLYLLLDILVHLQYQHRPTLSLLAAHAARAAPTLGVLVFYSKYLLPPNRHAAHPVTIWFLSAASILSGARLIWLVNKAGWSLTTDQAPPMGTLWILTIVQLPLSRAVMALLGLTAWVYWTGYKISP